MGKISILSVFVTPPPLGLLGNMWTVPKETLFGYYTNKTILNAVQKWKDSSWSRIVMVRVAVTVRFQKCTCVMEYNLRFIQSGLLNGPWYNSHVLRLLLLFIS